MDGFYLKSDERSLVKYVKNVGELSIALEKCPIGCVKFHLREGKNDFAEWIKNSLKDMDLSRRLVGIKLDAGNPERTRAEIINALKATPGEQETPKYAKGYKRTGR